MIRNSEFSSLLKSLFDKTLDYVQRFSRYKNKATVEEVRQYD
jgi:hypothetical protein